MNSINLTFGEGSEVTASEKPDLYELVQALTKQIASLQLQLEQVKAGQAQQYPPQKNEEAQWEDSRYQIYFRDPITVKQVTEILRDCIADGIT